MLRATYMPTPMRLWVRSPAHLNVPCCADPRARHPPALRQIPKRWRNQFRPLILLLEQGQRLPEELGELRAVGISLPLGFDDLLDLGARVGVGVRTVLE